MVRSRDAVLCNHTCNKHGHCAVHHLHAISSKSLFIHHGRLRMFIHMIQRLTTTLLCEERKTVSRDFLSIELITQRL